MAVLPPLSGVEVSGNRQAPRFKADSSLPSTMGIFTPILGIIKILPSISDDEAIFSSSSSFSSDTISGIPGISAGLDER